MTWVSRRVFVSLLGTALVSVLSACSSTGADGAVGTSGETEAFVTIDTSAPPIVVLENRTGAPLVDVSVTLKSGILTFSDSIARLEANERRQMRHADFSSRDGTSFSLRLTTPRQVMVTAKNLEGKQFETTTRW